MSKQDLRAVEATSGQGPALALPAGRARPCAVPVWVISCLALKAAFHQGDLLRRPAELYLRATMMPMKARPPP